MNLPIGELAKRTTVKVPTIRFYEQIGLLPEPPRTESGQRRYGEPEVDRLNFIRHARELGFAVDDIRELLAMAAAPQQSCHHADSIALNHLAEVERRIASLQALKTELTRMVDECGHGRVCDCRIIEALADHSHCVTNHPGAGASPPPDAARLTPAI
ncbi:MAG: helix-turn-helix domain-containing protein [Devosia nanyangense]|uniref:Helix-turn-helix domain-containing protein n=1 Tax=Devosia nanyangense TaxID=1228055 RepID=A0A933L6C9_9HYPH|nr:helix-turn-helix domain-containing protein [Devosia nanyangense]